MLLMGSGADLIATRVGASGGLRCGGASQPATCRTGPAGGTVSADHSDRDTGGVISKDECIRTDMTAERLAKLPQTFQSSVRMVPIRSISEISGAGAIERPPMGSSRDV